MIMINHSAIHNLILITILNIYNPLNNIESTKEKSEKKKKKTLPNTWFLKNKVLYKQKKIEKEDKDKSLYSPHSK